MTVGPRQGHCRWQLSLDLESSFLLDEVHAEDLGDPGVEGKVLLLPSLTAYYPGLLWNWTLGPFLWWRFTVELNVTLIRAFMLTGLPHVLGAVEISLYSFWHFQEENHGWAFWECLSPTTHSLSLAKSCPAFHLSPEILFPPITLEKVGPNGKALLVPTSWDSPSWVWYGIGKRKWAVVAPWAPAAAVLLPGCMGFSEFTSPRLSFLISQMGMIMLVSKGHWENINEVKASSTVPCTQRVLNALSYSYYCYYCVNNVCIFHGVKNKKNRSGES